MPNWPFRFVHTGDFHLEMPLFGVPEVPGHLREIFLESAYMSAERVFETALGEEVDFLVLAGDILDCRHTGPRGPLFLVEQFERLAAARVDVYWAGGQIDARDDWPPSIRLPDNVHRFSSLKPEEHIHRREGTPLVRIIAGGRAAKGRIRTADYDPALPGLFAVAVAHGHAEVEAFKAARVDYWALGGRHDRLTVAGDNPTVHYAGSPQGRHPEECGPHGCTLVQVDEHSQIQMSLVATDMIRWQSDQIEVDANTTPEGLEVMLSERAKSLLEAAGGIDQMVCWTVTGSGPLLVRLRGGAFCEQLLERLRKLYGQATPALWSVGISSKPSQRLPRDWYEPSTIRGDFLLTVKELKKHPELPLGLERFLPDAADEEIVGVAHPGGNGRKYALREAALLGADLLSGEEAAK